MYYIGEILLFARPPVNASGWLLCNGQTIHIRQNRSSSKLYSLIGNKYGGDEYSFGLPDLSKEAALFGEYMGYYICCDLIGEYPRLE